MKVLALVLFVVAVAQGRSTPAESLELAALGENPWVVHLRLAVSNRGILYSCVGTLVSDGFVLSTASCLNGARFIWVRYGVVEVIRPELVTEASAVINHPTADLALIRINRVIESSDYINPIAIAGANDELPERGKLCIFGAEENGGPGENLRCSTVGLSVKGEKALVSGYAAGATKFDLGAPLVANGQLIGVLSAPSSDDNSDASFLKVSDYLEWINSEIGVQGQSQVEDFHVNVVDHV